MKETVRELDVLRIYREGMDMLVLAHVLLPDESAENFNLVIFYDYNGWQVAHYIADERGYAKVLIGAPEGMEDREVYGDYGITLHEEGSPDFIRSFSVKNFNEYLRYVSGLLL